MKTSTIVFVIVFVLLAVLHQDVWNWDKATLVTFSAPAAYPH